MTIDLTTQEHDYLADLLRRALSELRDEVHHTDSFDYRELLKAQERLIHELLRKLGVEVAAA